MTVKKKKKKKKKKRKENAQMNESIFLWTGKSEWYATIIIHACTYG